MDKMDEQILVVKRSWLFANEELAFQGVLSGKQHIDLLNQHLDEGIETMRRGDAEENILFKQPIPYVIIKRDNYVFIYKRLQAGGEVRLHNKFSIGVGGHMNPYGEDFKDCIMENTERELNEELNIPICNTEWKTIGFINDDSNDVGKVHIGILITMEIPSGTEISVKETNQLSGEWISIEELKKPEIFSQLENWSKIASDIL